MMKFKSSQPCPTNKSGNGRRKWDQKVPSLSVPDDFYVNLVNTLVTALLGDWAPKLVCLEHLPRFCASYAASAALVRECDLDLYFRYQQIASFLKKLELSVFSQDSEEAALSKWREAEASCKEKNAEVWDIKTHPLTHSHEELESVLSKVRKEISQLLGDDPPDLDEVAKYMRFGPGASLSHSKDEGASAFKLLNSSSYAGLEEEVYFLSQHTLFRDLLFEADPVLGCLTTSWGSSEAMVEWFDVAKYQTVPKSVSIVRPIEIGPSLTTFIQQGYDGFLRQRLKGWGIDLSNQDLNKELARQGSIMGNSPNAPCTIDLVSASDMISFGVVYSVMSPAWVRTLSRYRAKQIALPDGTLVKLEKFSSMGNALTFSLQTLIFSAVVRSVLRDQGWEGSRWRVYGDDIIVPRRAYECVVRRLTVLGFKVNEEKSFSSGYFRESCGGDYLHGTAVRPFYLKKPLYTVADVTRLLNNIQLYAQSAPIPASSYEPVYSMVLSLIPKELRLYGSTDRGSDSCIWAPRVHANGERLAYRELRDEVKLPDKLAMLSCLLTGYTASLGHDKTYEGGFIPSGVSLVGRAVGRKEVLVGLCSPIQPHVPPVVAGKSRGIYIRKAPKRGYVAAVLPRELLPFDPMLLG